VSVETLLAEKRICICVGAGGVGKTTTAAAIALGLAATGRRVALVTIDPSRRLASALSLDELSNDPQRITEAHLAATGIDLAGGELWAMVLDPKQTFDELVRRLAPDERARERVFSNHIYREISNAVGGSHEFTAIAKLYALDHDGTYDAIVLDTPPSRDTLEFLRAPQRLIQFFDARALRLLLAPAGLGARLASHARVPALALLRRLVGVDLLTEIALFFAAMGGLIGGFRERASAVEALLHDPASTFVIVSSPESEAVRESIAFTDQLREAGLQPGALVVNRVHHGEDTSGDPATVRAALTAALGERLAGAVWASVADVDARAVHDQAGVERLRRDLSALPQSLIPSFDATLGDLPLLGEVARRLFSLPSS
jgi:anion-transporting  ArsA/GET3 family ATPase